MKLWLKGDAYLFVESTCPLSRLGLTQSTKGPKALERFGRRARLDDR